MNFTNDSLIATQKSNAEAFAGLSKKAFASFEKLVELNMAAARALMGESLASLQALSEIKNTQALLAFQSGLLKPLSDKAASYNRHLLDIVSGSTAEFSKVFESTSAQSQKSVTALLDASLKNAPAGSQAAAALFKSAIDAGTTAVESAQKSTRQALQVVESNLASQASTGQKVD